MKEVSQEVLWYERIIGPYSSANGGLYIGSYQIRNEGPSPIKVKFFVYKTVVPELCDDLETTG